MIAEMRGCAAPGFGVKRSKRSRPDEEGRPAREVGMRVRQDFLVLVALAAAAATPAVGQTTAPAAPAGSTAQKAAAVPDFEGVWNHPSLPWFEPLASGPRPVTNRSRKNGVSNYDQLVGDYTNPILQPWAADVVKKFGDVSLAGVTFPNPANQCWPEPPPFLFKHNQMMLIQKPDEVTMIYVEDHEVRRIRLNQTHPAEVTPSWHGDSVGHYEGDTLVVDTIGVRTDRPYAMIDLFGTPYTKALHVVERYRLLDPQTAKDGVDRMRKENMVFGDISHSKKYLQLMLTIEDPGVFTTPWSVTVTYGGSDDWVETVCAENIHEYYYNKNSDVPADNHPDF
jgi:hypothetical protein